MDKLYLDVEAKKEIFDKGSVKVAEVEKKIETKIRSWCKHKISGTQINHTKRRES